MVETSSLVLDLKVQEWAVGVRWWTLKRKLSGGDSLPCHSCEDPSEPGSLPLLTTSGSKTFSGPCWGRSRQTVEYYRRFMFVVCLHGTVYFLGHERSAEQAPDPSCTECRNRTCNIIFFYFFFKKYVEFFCFLERWSEKHKKIKL